MKMAAYQYHATSNDGGQVKGVLEAGSEAEAVSQLSKQGLWATSVQEQAVGGRGGKRGGFGRKKISKKVVESFTRSLSDLLQAGVPLSKALRIICRETSHPVAKKQLEQIVDHVTDGSSLAESLARYPKSFPMIYIAMVQAGETGGFLDVVLGQIADMRSRERDLVSRIQSALIYPVVLSFVAAGVMIFLLTYFIPKFSLIFADFGSDLPLLTKVIVGLSDGLLQYGAYVLIVLAVVLTLLKRFGSTEQGRRTFERLVLKLPGFGTVVARFALIRFTSLLGTLLKTGVPLVTALNVAKSSIGNQVLTDTVDRAVDDVKQGASLSSSFGQSPVLFPKSVIEMIAVSEESGQLDQALLRIAESHEKDLDIKLRTLVSLFEPAMLFVLAALVGTIVIGMLLPVFELQDLIQ
ncbi:type II secretion system F family protein [Poriferisphaera sp. WC338]|uniref:type II secretion system F family protein n=1 Tax=Poriferisphaera sp. WC338 TaxID=3425129 RepID=UPI003D81C13E